MHNAVSPRQLGTAIGVSESSIKRWIDQDRIPSVRTNGGHRRILVNDALTFIRGNGYLIEHPAVLGLSDLVSKSEQMRSDATTPDHLVQAFMDADRARVCKLVVSGWLNQMSICELCDDLIAPAMHRVGSLWRDHSEGIAIEHQATDACIQALNALRGFIGEPTNDAPIAVGGGPADDPYLLPSLMAATVLGTEGYRDMNLGPQTPFDVLEETIDRVQPTIVWLSVSSVEPGIRFIDHVRRIADKLQPIGGSMLIGGRAWDMNLQFAEDNIYSVLTMGELAARTRSLRSRSG